jgi:WD40 repeat protein
MLGRPEGHLATFHSPDWRWHPTGQRFSPDGQFAFSTACEGLLQWDVTEQQLKVRFHGDLVVLSPDCRTVVRVARAADADARTTEEDATVEICDLTLERCVRVLGTERTFGTPVEFLPDGRRVLVWLGNAPQPSQLAVCDLHNGTKLVLETDEPSSHAICLSADGRRLAIQTADKENHRVQVVETTTGRQVAFTPSWAEARCIAISTDGVLVAIGGESSDATKERGEIQVWQVADGKRLTTLVDPATWGITALCFAPDGKTLAAGDGGGVIKRWTIPSPEDAASEKIDDYQ